MEGEGGSDMEREDEGATDLLRDRFRLCTISIAEAEGFNLSLSLSLSLSLFLSLSGYICFVYIVI